jgi:2-keto-4-pentenoate hydratase/2-oxohepta-3-ene-1,7-dioic acid hydratase in catechol pathway
MFIIMFFLATFLWSCLVYHVLTSFPLLSLYQWQLTTPQVMCIGRNYADHIKELNSARPKQPFFFLKPPSAILLPGAGPVLRPKGVIMHYEVELALIIGKQVKDLHPEDTQGALDAISGKSSMFGKIKRTRIIRRKGSILPT